MKLLSTIKKIIYLAPVRCGRTFYSCEINETDTVISLKFTPTDEYLTADPRREDEVFMPHHVHVFEQWEHTGLAIGSLEHFLTANSINYTIDNSSIDSYIVVNIDNVELDNPDLSLQQLLKHAYRTFDVDTAIDTETHNTISTMIDEFLVDHDGYKTMVTDAATRKKLYALAIYWETDGEFNGHIKAPQMNAPLIITVPPKKYDTAYYLHMGRLYAKIGLTALSRGYRLGYCNAFNYFDPRIARVKDAVHLEFGTYTVNDVVPRSFICIGKPLDETKPYNWDAVRNGIMHSCTLLTKTFVKVFKNSDKENV